MSSCGIDAHADHLLEKTWERNVAHGSISITLFAGLPYDRKLSSLVILSQPYNGPTVDDEASALDAAIREMPALGYDPRGIAFINMRCGEPDVIERLIQALASTRKWGLHGDGSVAVVEALNAIGAYKKLGDVLAKYGLTVKVTGAEHIGHARLSSLDLRDSIPGGDPAMWVATSAEIVLRTAKIEK